MITEKLSNGKYKLSIIPRGFLRDSIFEEHTDKFLYDVNKTVGFRKDKKLSKFVGLRDGASKQLEFTLVSVILDGVNKISNKIKFSSVKLEDESVVHNINNTKFYNEVTNTNYKHMVEISDPFNSLEILYEIHIKGIKVSNRIINNVYQPNNENRFMLVDINTIETIFIFDTPIVIDVDGNEYNIVQHKLFIENDKLYYKKTVGVTIDYNFPLYVDANVIINEDVNLYSGGVGILSSTGTTWDEITGGTNTTLYYNSSIGQEEEALVYRLSGSTYTSNRTFLNFDTSFFSSYTEVLSSVKLLLTNYRVYYEPISVYEGTQGNTLTTGDWNNYGDEITSGVFTTGNETIEFNIPISYFNLNGLTSLALLSTMDEPISEINSYTGIDFSNTILEVIYEPIKVYGQTELNVQKGDYFTLTGYTNSGSSSNIQWYRDSGYTNFISSGSTLTGYSLEYQINNKIYGIIPISFDTGYSQPLIVTINVIQLNYETLPVKNIDYDEIDIDSIYFKFHKCFSGVCYSYIRDINDAFEGSPLVSDSWGNESYNLYNEYDIIDEFFSNSHEVEVAYNSNLDLTKRYNSLDGVFLREGTRVLLMAQTDLNELGVYVVQYDSTLIRTDEMNTYEDLFRYKAQVGAGTYADQEVHVWPILPPLDAPYITLSNSSITFIGLSGDELTLTITSNVSWSLSTEIGWIVSNIGNGNSGTTIITLTTTMENSGGLRSGILNFIGDLVTATLVVNQGGLENFRLLFNGSYRVTIDGDGRILI